MLRITKLTDYAIVVLSHLVQQGEQGGNEEASVCTARLLASKSSLPAPTVSKILKELAKGGVLESQRGLAGGYRLARSPEAITIAQVVKAVEGPIALTECSAETESCALTGQCPVEANWVKINQAILSTLDGITLADMARPILPRLVQLTAKPMANAAPKSSTPSTDSPLLIQRTASRLT